MKTAAALAALLIAGSASADPVPYLQLKGHKPVKAAPSAQTAQTGVAVFTGTSYDSTTDLLEHPQNKAVYENPILPGFYPDPSIVRVKDDYYLVNSSFAYWPGIPVFHSKDLVNWQQIGNAIDRPNQLDFSNLGTSRGVFAPQISYHDGLYWIVNTCVDCKGNFVITAKDPAGPWSDPVWIDIGGIDPSIFWDDDGQAWVVHNDDPDGPPQYPGHRAIWIQRFDPVAKKMVGPHTVIVNGGTDISKKPVWIEGPHIYKINGAYYLMCAEGGTAEDHSEVIFRSDKVDGPYVPYAGNPILTQRDLDPNRALPVTSSGHADLVQTPGGDWYAVFLGTQPYQDKLYNTGRQTFMLPVSWRKDAQGVSWPLILPRDEPMPLLVDLPKGAQTGGKPHYTGATKRVGYASAKYEWLQVRTPGQPFLTVNGAGKAEKITLKALPEAIGDEKSHPAFIGLRQRHVGMTFQTTVSFHPAHDGDRAGIMALQNDDFYLFYGLTRVKGQTMLEVSRRDGKGDPVDGQPVTYMPAPAGPVTIRLDIDGGTAKFSFGAGRKARVLKDNVDATNLSTARAGGFVGTIVGLYAYSQKP